MTPPSQSLIGSRYDLYVAATGAAESKAARDYYAIHESDVEAVAGRATTIDRLCPLRRSRQHRRRTRACGSSRFLTGCLLRCQYCHNPDTWHKQNGKPFSVAQAMQAIGKYAQVLKISKGGITLSGGEPIVQRAFATRIFRRCKELGLHTCCDTSGRLGDRLTDEQLMDIDLNLLDIKSGDPEIYEKVTRQPLQPTLDYARRLSALRPADVGALRARARPHRRLRQRRTRRRVLRRARSLERVEILRFHQLGRDKWHKLGLDYPLKDVEPPSAELTERVRGQFRSRGLTVY